MRVLLIEDDELIAHGILAGLRAHGLTVDGVRTSAQAEAALSVVHCDVVILDLGLPDEDGMRLLQRLRANGMALPVLILTARDAVEDRVAGLRAGADDYLLKPFDLNELVARLQALLRRAAGRSVDVIEHGPLRLDPASGEVSLHGRAIALSRRELALLAALLHAGGRILSPDQLKDSLYDFSEEIESNALNVHIHHLRRKLGADVIETVRGVGYRFSAGKT
ncbi:MAG: response regulator [Polaromonas sp.]|uniref:response regulator n=2 Tax=Polaromonas sp. TaxID=1869339 RepID=UPI002487671D|nr:response regulator [Polaromonas sp.]MDI1271061.1 response regulator [Polaromonas sp.]MDO9114359.1 response regulator [Polaromonas sp.]MDP1886000.1 response regulator [Polaromonas sp.]MDP3245425.1 response regulator [Polaromonas sp.]MDP3753952.1 response regulator [Polaromonas sp.]